MRRVFCAVVITVFMCISAYAQESDAGDASQKPAGEGLLADLGFELSGDLAFNSIYMWRGIMLDGDPVVQPGFYVKTPESKFGRLKLGWWMSHDLENRDALKSSETDLIVDYTYNFPSFDVSVGHTYYDFPDALPADGATKGWSREFYAGFSFPKIFLSPSVFYYYDYGRKEDGGGEGNYTVLNLAYSIPMTIRKNQASLDFTAHLGHNNKLYYRGTGGDAACGVGLTLPLTSNLSCKPNVNYSVPWGNISDKGNGNQKSRFYAGIYLSYNL
ncbi:MAG: hypothetical protein PHR11_01880 [Candidatus Omnitrophica bacterium]|nr:hypothetical protein [Candidatus Omnitrophota bacterium]